MQGGGAHRPAQLYRAKPGFSQTLALTARGFEAACMKNACTRQAFGRVGGCVD
jgi:hypothetical protein